ncbi:MAG: hypothetical protein ABSA33_05990, partial [Candidatus Micrarchaeaceae archaeon]
IKKELFVEDSSLHWAASLILLCYLVLARIIDDIPTRKLRLLSFSAIFVTSFSSRFFSSSRSIAMLTLLISRSLISALMRASSSIISSS